MKIIFSSMFYFFSFAAAAQMNKGGLIAKDLAGLPGNWTGTMVYTAEQSQVTYKTQLTVVDMKDSLLFKFTHTDPEGKVLTENYAMRVYEDGNKMSFDSSEYDMAAIRRRGVRLEIIIEREGVDNFRSADFQQSIIIGPANLNIVKKIRYRDMVDYFIRSRTVLTKNK
jgi:hypothetical protein